MRIHAYGTWIRIWHTASKISQKSKSYSVLFQFWFLVLLNIGIQPKNGPNPPSRLCMDSLLDA
jgi:hypothetical protein